MLKKIQIILTSKKNNEIFFLLLKRVGTKDSWWQGITGAVESYDKDYKAAVIRETKEEIGFVINSNEVLGPIKKFYFITSRKGYENTKANEMIFYIQLPYNFRPSLNEENSNYKWVKFKNAFDLIKFPESKEALKLIYEKLSKK